MVFAALAPQVLAGSSATPGATGAAIDPGAYNAFPLATSGANGQILVVWQHARSHVGTGAMFVQGRVRSAAGQWGAPFPVWDDASATIGVGASGVTFMPARGSYPAQWLLLGQSVTFTSSTSSTVASRTPKVRVSTNATSWSALSANPFAGAVYEVTGNPGTPVPTVFPSSVLWVDDDSDGGNLYAAAYMKISGRPWKPLVSVSRDRGATWTILGSPYVSTGAVPSGADLTEPTLSPDPSYRGGVLVWLREEQTHAVWRGALNDLSTMVDPSAAPWTTVGRPDSLAPTIQGVSGLPVVHQAPDGTWHAFLRDWSKNRGDSTHAPWSWWTSPDGVQWVNLGDFTGTGRASMYGGVVDLPDGSMLVVHASEDSATWGPCSVYTSHLVQVACSADVRYDAGPPRVVISTSLPGQPTRTYTDPITGEYVVEPVRLSDGGGTVWTDYEVPQGVPITYETPSGTTDPVIVRELDGLWIIHPVRPELSVLVTPRAQDDPETHALDFQSISVGRTDFMGRDVPVTSASATRSVPSGKITVQTENVWDEARMNRLQASGSSLFLSAHRGHGYPRWVRFSTIQSSRVIQYCGDGRRLWELPYVTDKRPTAVDMPSTLRIRDLAMRVRDFNATVRNGLYQ